MPLLLLNPVRRYGWGSRTVIPELLGRTPDGQPQAELWLGANPAASSLVLPLGIPLSELVVADPEQMLGPEVHARFGARLPYLLKVLAVEQPLSIQAHPTKAQARAGLLAENAAGIPLDAPTRSFRDLSDKPEMVLALTDFEALVGFRRPEESAELLAALHLPALDGLIRGLAVGDLEVVVRRILQARAEDTAYLVAEVASACSKLDAGEPFALLANLAERYSGDRGVLLAALLDRVTLVPGEALFIPAGMPHSYLRGVAVEVQANSDNTLRAGLTPKHIDLDALARVLRYEAGTDPRVSAKPGDAGEEVFAVSGVEEFRLSRVRLTSSPVRSAPGPALVLVTAGSATVESARGRVQAGRGQAAFVPAAEGSAAVSGTGVAYVVTPNLA